MTRIEKIDKLCGVKSEEIQQTLKLFGNYIFEEIKMTVEQSNNITIDINASMDASPLEMTSLIHQHEMKKVTEFINKNIDLISTEGKNPPRRHNTVTISGERGRGKTTFLLSLFKIV